MLPGTGMYHRNGSKWDNSMPHVLETTGTTYVRTPRKPDTLLKRETNGTGKQTKKNAGKA